jgi:pilus assembly protein CpaB
MKRELTAALALAAAACVMTGVYLRMLEAKYKRGFEQVKVLAARQYIDQGVVIDGTMVEETPVPKSYIQPRALRSPRELVNAEGRRAFMTIVPVEKGEQLVTTKLFMLGMDTGLSAVVPSGKRAVTLMCGRGSVSGILKPGNRVDVIGVFEQGSSTILRNILVLSVDGVFFGADLLNTPGKTGPAGGETLEGKSPVSLAVTPHEAELLALAEEKGSIRFALRGMGDDQPEAAPADLRITDLLKSPPVKAPEAGREASQLLDRYRRKQP